MVVAVVDRQKTVIKFVLEENQAEHLAQTMQAEMSMLAKQKPVAAVAVEAEKTIRAPQAMEAMALLISSSTLRRCNYELLHYKQSKCY